MQHNFPTTASWQEWAACAQPSSNAEPDDFFPEYYSALPPHVLKLCGSCPVRSFCLNEALEANMEYGIWGGFTPGQRARLDTQKRVAILKAIREQELQNRFRPKKHERE